MPIPETDVVAVYKGVLRRDPSDAERVGYSIVSVSKSALISELIGCDENIQSVVPIIRLYQGVFGRKPDNNGLTAWVNAYRNDALVYGYSSDTEAITCAGFQNAPEFTSKYPATMSNTDFVTAVYQNVLNRAPDSGGLANWVNNLNSGAATRIGVFVAICNSAEYRNKCSPYVISFETAAANGDPNAYIGSLFS